MSKSLVQRLDDAKTILDKIDQAILRNSGKLSRDSAERFVEIASLAAECENWRHRVVARDTARTVLSGLEGRADHKGELEYCGVKADFQTARLLGVQSLLAAQWALADRLVGVAGRVLCVHKALRDPRTPPQMISCFAGKGAEERSTAIVFSSLRDLFGWPIAMSYALRNHFIHDGAGSDFFEGPTALSGFNVSAQGVSRILDRAKSYGILDSHTRLGGALTFVPGDDLRVILDRCGPEIDEALGVLVGTACRCALALIGLLVSED